MTFDEFVLAVDDALRATLSAAYGRFQGPHVAFWQFGAAMARVREGTDDDVELGRRDPATARRFGATIAAAFR